VTTGVDNCVIWNGVHHKTCLEGKLPRRLADPRLINKLEYVLIHEIGGAASFGYPDETYLERVTEELADLGVTAASLSLTSSIQPTFSSFSSKFFSGLSLFRKKKKKKKKNSLS